MSKENTIKVFGMELPVFLFFFAVIAASAWMNIIPNEMLGAAAILFSLGIVLGEIGERIPIWNVYCGGGAILAFVVSGLLTYYNLLPECVVENATGWMSGYNFLNVFISLLIVGSLLGMDRKVLIKSGSLFIPAILASIVGAGVLGILGGLVIGKSPMEIITAYVLPIMGGGAGAGAVPMAQVYGDVTGQDPAGYLSFALAILAVGNIVAVIFAVILDIVGRVMPKWTGHDKLMKDASKQIVVEKEEEKKVTMDDIGGAIFLTAGFFVLGQLMAKKVLPSIMGVAIPNFAYMILFAALANVFNLIPEHLRMGAKKCQQFCGSKLVWVQMVGCGIVLIDFREMLGVLSVSNLLVVVLIVLGAVLGAGLFGQLVGFYPVESAITAGLCMANMGGAGDLAVLGAARRMELMSYAQISSRIGGAIILLIGSIAFSLL
ncbi:damage-inducible protein CinA [Lachnoclostridium sp. An14]|uniref:2-hydroxycarboxylate transporter family protein n=1 Tax=Lachnoclostridium sp. An14 TaxID=1965562 RepID=UPI000B379EAA|nr:2-hydroxycarboxylate transporter family protein [Lachnoclostridium sp. An14]OUQ17425.1 damage-inducible protein CinA [Lachnoclostridium sp. An14]